MRNFRINRLKDKIDDRNYLLSKWGWSWNPSFKRKFKKKTEKLERKLEKLDV